MAAMRSAARFPFPSVFHGLLPAGKGLRAGAGLLFLALTLGVGAAAAQTQPIETVAGSSFSGDGGAATAARFNAPGGVAVDGGGNIYIADTFNHRIRKVTASSGNIETVAGVGGAGYSGDGGAATTARLSYPYGVAVDGSGNIYIADTDNHRIRRVDAATGNISTVAGDGTEDYGGDGGAARAAKLSSPYDVAVDGDGNLYIADTNNNRIRKVTASSGNIETVAGDGTDGYSGDGGAATSAEIDTPWGIALDSAGNIYFAGSWNEVVRKVTVSSGNIETVAGDGSNDFYGDGGAATDAALDGPRGLAVDGSGNIYIADSYNNRIRRVDTSGNIATFAGGGSAQGDGGSAAAAELGQVRGVAVDGSGNIYIADSDNNRIRKVDTSSLISTAAGGGTDIGDGGAARAAWLNDPSGVAVDESGNLYIADSNHHRVRRVSPSGTITTVAGTGAAGFSGDGEAAADAQLNNPSDVAVDAAGNIYIADTDNHRIRKVGADRKISTVAGTGESGIIGSRDFNGPAASAALSFPRGVAVDESGNLYIADTGNSLVLKVSRDTLDVRAGGIPDRRLRPRLIFAGALFSGPGGSINPGDVDENEGPGGSDATRVRLRSPTGLAVYGSNLYIADRGNNRIRRVRSGRMTTVAGTGEAGYGGDGGSPVRARLDNPYDVAVDSAGSLYIAEFSNHRIRRVAAGTITTVAGTGVAGFSGDGGAAGEARFNAPAGLALDGAGDLYIADAFNDRIRKFRPDPLPPSLGPSVEPVDVSELSFAPAPDAEPSAPMSQTLTLRAAGGEADFQVLPSARWIEISLASGGASWRGRLADGETVTLRVTVNPLGLRPGIHRGRLYIRSGGRLTARVDIVLEVPPPTGPDVSESGGVFNAARMSAYGEPGLFGPQLLPLSPGSLVAVQGVNFAEGRAVGAEGFPLPTSLGGARVLFNGAAAPLFSVGPQRIEAQLPWALGGEAVAAGGLALVSVVVESGGESSWPRRFWVGPSAPGVFTASGTGQGQALALFAGTTALAAPTGEGEGSRPARAGDLLEIYATGLGAVEPPSADGMNSCAPDGVCLADGSNAVLRRTTAQPQVWLDGMPIAAENIRFSGLAPNLAGVNLVVVEVPRHMMPSAAAELRLAVGGRASQSGVTVAVE